LHVSQATSATEITALHRRLLVLLARKRTRILGETSQRALKKTNSRFKTFEMSEGLIDSGTFQFRNFTSDDDLAFYTGFPSLATFNAIFECLNAGSNGKNIRYYLNGRPVQKCFYENETEECTIIGRGRSLEP